MSASRPSSLLLTEPVRTDARPRPLARWAVCVFLAPIAPSYFLGADLDAFFSIVRRTPHALLVVGALVFLLAAFELVRWVNRLRLARKRPDEPWLWDGSWKRELRDQQPGRVAGMLLLCLIFSAFLAVFHYLAFTEGISTKNLFLSFLLGAFLIAFDLALFKMLLKPTFLQVLALLRFGRMRLRLPELPLTLGSRTHVHLLARPSLAPLTGVMVELRRVREWSEMRGSGKERRSTTVSQTEYSQKQRVDAAVLREGKDLLIPLELPEADPKSSTVLHGPRRCYWELQLTSKVPGVDLDVTFVLPIYYSVGENPEPLL